MALDADLARRPVCDLETIGRRSGLPRRIEIWFAADPDPPVLKSAADLALLATTAGLRPDQETIVHCQAGIATTLDVFP
jgi:hypothetical protein